MSDNIPDPTGVDFVEVESSNIHSIGWTNSLLYVKFHRGGVYRYNDVPKVIFDDMLQAESMGKYLNEEVKPTFTFQRVR